MSLNKQDYMMIQAAQSRVEDLVKHVKFK